MGGVGRVGPHRLEPLDQVARRHDLDAQRAHRFDRPGVDPRHVGNRVAGRVFHRHPARPVEQLLQPGGELLAAGVGPLLAGQRVEVVALDRVHQPAGLAARRDEVVPAPRRHLAGRREARSRVAIGLVPWKS